MNNKYNVPQLDRNNPLFWKMALESTATTIDAFEHIISNPPTPIDPAHQTEHNKKKHTLRALVLSTVPSDILNLLSIGNDPTPKDLITAILEHLQTNTATDHKYLKSEAENLFFTPDMSIDDYLSKHNSLRARMIASQFPNIADETTTVEFLIDGLRHNPNTIDIGRQLIAINPPTVKDFMHHYHRLKSYNMTTSSPPTSTIYPNLNLHTQPQRPNFYQSRQLPRRQPYYAPAPTQPQLGFRPCSFHQQFMRVPPNHTDEQCRDTRHPKFNRQAPPVKQENRAAAPRANQVIAMPTIDYANYFNPNMEPFPPAPPNNWDYTAYPAMNAMIPNHPPVDQQPEENNTVEGKFILDSAAHPTHIQHPPQSLPLTKTLSTRTAANHETPCTHAGNIQIRLHNEHPPLRVLCVAPKSLHSNLLSVHDTAKQYGAVLFTPQHGHILNLNNPHLPPIVATAPWHKNCYALNSLTPSNTPSALGARTFTKPPRKLAKTTQPSRQNKAKPAFLRQTPALPSKRFARPISTPRLSHIPPSHTLPPITPTTESFFHWHVILNHMNLNKLQRMAVAKTIPILPNSLRNPPPSITCSTCPTAKQQPSPHKNRTHKYASGSYISSDTCGPFKPRSRYGNLHYVSYIDTHSRYLIIFFIPNRTFVKQTTPLAFAFIKSHHGKPPTIYRSDNAKEFQSNEMNSLYNHHGIEYRSNTPHQPQENSLAERINQTIVTATRAALHHSQLDESFWEDAMKDVVFKYNISMHDTTGKSPYQMWHNHSPELVRLFAFGQLGTIPNYNKHKTKFESRADPARFMHNISPTHIVALNLRTNQYTQLRSIDFRPYSHHLDPLYHKPQALISSKHTMHPIPLTITLTTLPPNTLAQAKQYPDASSWETAHDEELDTLDSNNTIEWIPDDKLPPHIKLIPLKMTYRYKRSDDGTITRHKARCTVRGDRMTPYVHFNPEQVTTYTAERPSIRTIMCITAAFNLVIEQFDISSAFLHEQYQHSKPVFVSQLPRSDGSYKHNCRAGMLKGNLYGTPPASHIYFEALAEFLISKGYTQTDSDPCLFLRFTPKGPIFISITIDDFLVASPQVSTINQLYNDLKSRYDIRRMGEPKLFLNWRIQRYPNGAIHISQPHTIRTILAKHKLEHCNPKPTPYIESKPLQPPANSTALCAEKAYTFRQTVGELRYVADSTRPDIVHSVSRLAADMHQPTHTNWGQLRYLLKYLKGTLSHGILYNSTPYSTLISYADASFGNSPDRKSYSGIVHLLTKSPIMWQSSKQKTVAMSTCEAEYLAASTAAQQSMWLRRLLTDLGHCPSSATLLRVDNKAAVLVANQTAPTKHRKYIDLRHHFLHNLVKSKRIAVQHTPSTQMLADILTKPLKKQPFTHLREALNILPPPATDCHQRDGGC